MQAGDRVCVCVPSSRCFEGRVVSVGRNDVVVMIHGIEQTVPKRWVSPYGVGCATATDGLARKDFTRNPEVHIQIPGARTFVRGQLIKVARANAVVDVNGVKTSLPRDWIQFRALAKATGRRRSGGA